MKKRNRNGKTFRIFNWLNYKIECISWIGSNKKWRWHLIEKVNTKKQSTNTWTMANANYSILICFILYYMLWKKFHLESSQISMQEISFTFRFLQRKTSSCNHANYLILNTLKWKQKPGHKIGIKVPIFHSILFLLPFHFHSNNIWNKKTFVPIRVWSHFNHEMYGFDKRYYIRFNFPKVKPPTTLSIMAVILTRRELLFHLFGAKNIFRTFSFFDAKTQRISVENRKFFI